MKKETEDGWSELAGLTEFFFLIKNRLNRFCYSNSSAILRFSRRVWSKNSHFHVVLKILIIRKYIIDHYIDHLPGISALTLFVDPQFHRSLRDFSSTFSFSSFKSVIWLIIFLEVFSFYLFPHLFFLYFDQNFCFSLWFYASSFFILFFFCISCHFFSIHFFVLLLYILFSLITYAIRIDMPINKYRRK